MTSKFFKGKDGSSSDSDDSSSSGSDSDAAPQVQVQTGARKMARWAEESSSEEEDQKKRVVQRHTDKRFDQMKERIREMTNHQKNGDFAQLTNDYETILKMLEKNKAIVEHEGGPPAIFIQAITGLELYLERTHAEIQKKKQEKKSTLSEAKAKAFNTLRAKVRKGNKDFADEVAKCKEDPTAFEVEQESEPESPSSESESSASEAAASSDDSSSSSDSDSDSSDSDSSDSSSDSDSSSGSSSSGSSSSSSSESRSASWKTGSDDSDEEGLDEESAREKKMLRWLITPEALKKQQEREEKEREKETRKREAGSKPKPSGRRQEDAEEAGRKAKPSKEEDLTPEKLMKQVTEILNQRGRRGFDRKSYMGKLTELMAHAVKQGPRAQLYILSSMVWADFDNTGSAFEAMKISTWNEALGKVAKMLPLIKESYQDLLDGKKDDVSMEGEEEDPRSHPRQQELFISFVEKLDDELYKALQFTVDVYGADYQDILGNSSKFLVLLKRVHKFFEETQQTEPLGTMALRLMEQLYYKPDMLNRKVYEAISHGDVAEDEKAEWVWPVDSRVMMMKLVNQVFASTKSRPLEYAQKLTRRASLCQAYHLALHGYFQASRDLLWLGHLQEQACESDVHTQILYNRVIAQMGLCAFRLGKIQDAHNCLMEVCMHNKARELLAQGLSFSKTMDRTAEQERAERLRQLPYHMHINLEVLESAHHISAMLLEIPNMAMQSIVPGSGRVISRLLRRALDQYEKQPYAGPPENAKESVVSAAKFLQRGDWQSAFTALEDLKLWDHIDPGNPDAGPRVKQMVKERIQTEALRTYLFAFASIYDAFHLDQLVGMFGLQPKQVHSIVSNMMMKSELAAFWDESSRFVLVQHSEPTALQRLALSLAERAASAMDSNERLVEQKTGGGGCLGNKDQRGPQQGMYPGGAATRGRFGKGGGFAPGVLDGGKGAKGKGRGVKGTRSSVPAGDRGWGNARAGANLRGTGQSAPGRAWGSVRNNP